MAAIITDKVKTKFLKDLLLDLDSAGTNFYIGIGRSQQWNSTDTPPVPTVTETTERDFRNNLQSVIVVDDASMVVPRYEWSSGNIYSAYSDNVAGYPTNPYYVVTDANAVYVCIQQGRDNVTGAAVASTVEPTGTNTFNTGELGDGYIWKFLYTIGAAQANSFVTAAYIPVKRVDSAGGDGDLSRDTEQYNIQNAALDGQIVGFRVTNGGTNYSSAPSVSVFGDNETNFPVKATAIVNPSTKQVVNIKIADSAGTLAFGRGYTRASVVIGDPASGTTATAEPIIGPVGGIGFDARNDLKASAVMYNARPEGTAGGKFVTDNDYRQFGLLKNITLAESDGGIPTQLFDGTTGIALRKLSVSGATGTFLPDDSISGGTSLANCILDSNYANVSLYYHQDRTTGFRTFSATETITGTPSTATATVVSDSAGDINPYSGEVFFVSNQEGIDRSTASTDDLKIVIQL